MANGWVSLTGGWNWDVPKEARLNPEITYGTMTDSRDGKTYKTVKIGNQTWMAENLNYSDSVTTTSLIDESWCYNDVAANCDVAGRLYSWWAAIDYDKTGCGNGPICLTSLPVRGICPEGWHLPDSTEWNTLFAAVGGASTAGKMLKSQGGWNNDYDGSIVKGIDAYGFSALPAGHRYNNGFFSDEGRNARFWTASEDSSARDLSFRSGAYYVSLISSNEYAFIDSYVKSKGHSVRCLKD
ncbi:MAG: fibrobacter succinogenes major paralogous domain-containing protein [Fibrobacter sp.]|nr:fibrobacter succinogenes major paralogous domain-containing protein [Fibrobacter sp.]